MNSLLLSLALALLGSFLWRVRGGLLEDFTKNWKKENGEPVVGSFISRIPCAVFLASPALIQNDLLALTTLLVISYTAITLRLFPWQFMMDENVEKDVLKMGLRGLLVTLPVYSGLLVFGLVPFSPLFALASVLLGLSMGPSYYLGQYIQHYRTGNPLGASDEGNHYAEWIYGAVIGLLMALFLLGV